MEKINDIGVMYTTSTERSEFFKQEAERLAKSNESIHDKYEALKAENERLKKKIEELEEELNNSFVEIY